MSRSPLKPPKNRDFKCISGLIDKIPPGAIVNTFPLYDANIELSLVRDDRFVVAHTRNYCTYEFWRCVQTDPDRVAEVLPHIVPFKSPKMFYAYQDRFQKYPDPFARSAIFFMLNQISNTGLISTGEQEKPEPDPTSLSKLRRFDVENFYIKFNEAKQLEAAFSSLSEDEYLVIFCGRYSENLFKEGKPIGPEETDIIHKDVLNFFENTKKKVVLLYHPHKTVFSIYKDYNIQMYNKWGIKTNSKKDCEEVLIANF